MSAARVWRSAKSQWSARVRRSYQDGNKHPADRLEQAIGLIGRLAVAGALLVVTVRGNVDDVRALDGADARANLRRLADEGELDLTDGAASRGRTSDGAHQSIANVDPAADGRAVARRPRLTEAARTRLGEFDIATGARIRRMLDADEQTANMLLERFGRRATALVDDFEEVWTRWRRLDLPDAMLRVYHDQTGLDGVRYFARQPNNAAGRAEYIAGGWACLREEEFRNVFPNAGHSVARHGPHVPDDALERRITEGEAPDVAEHVQRDRTKSWEHVASPTDRSTRFLSFRDWNDAHDSAYLTLQDQFGLDMGQGPIVGTAGQEYPIARGYIPFRDIDNPSRILSRPLGEGYEAIVDGSERRVEFRRPDGSSFRDDVYPNTRRVPSSEIRHCYTTMGWTGAKWIIINIYPAKLPRPTTVVAMARTPNHGRSTI